ncbi:uncharacterized protein LOC135834098 [Planococcus citri]|uniref:uncharacterized protein LOC135834098 n=1 Tax=Planococcus citri TaxID=170843 RepID=UPI0031F7792B
MFEHRTIPGLAEDRRLVFYKSVPTLQDFASSTVALSIWFNYVEWSRTRNVIVAFNDNLAAALGIDSNYPEEIAQFVERLQTPKRIEAMIKASVYQVGQNMTECISYYDDAFGLPVTLYGIEYFDINWFVWYRNGQIDYRKTASRVLLSEEREISDEAEEPEERKFLILCKYCMEEEIRTIPLTASLLESRSFRFANFEHNFLTYYWVCFLKNELHQIPLGNFTSINVVMAKRCTYEERYAFQYFWNRLGDADRLLVIGDGFESRFQCGVISTMSVEQQGLMFYRMPPGESVVNFFNHLDILGVAFSTWMLVKDRITMEQFSRLVVTLFSRWIYEFAGQSLGNGL